MNPAAVAVPLILAMTGFLFISSKKNYFDSFLQGAKNGLVTSVNLIPTLVALIVAVSMFRASGALDILADLLAPVFDFAGISRELIGYIIMRPLSGSGSTAMINDIFHTFGADSEAGRAASLIMGSSDTVFYIFAVYFGAVKTKRVGTALLAAVFTQIFCAVLSSFIVKNFF